MRDMSARGPRAAIERLRCLGASDCVVADDSFVLSRTNCLCYSS